MRLGGGFQPHCDSHGICLNSECLQDVHSYKRRCTPSSPKVGSCSVRTNANVFWWQRGQLSCPLGCMAASSCSTRFLSSSISCGMAWSRFHTGIFSSRVFNSESIDMSIPSFNEVRLTDGGLVMASPAFYAVSVVHDQSGHVVLSLSIADGQRPVRFRLTPPQRDWLVKQLLNDE